MPAPQSTTSEYPTPAAVTLRGPVNEAAAYGVRLEPANAPGDSPFWQVVNVRHLSADENRGKHNVFVRVLDATGQRDRNPALRAAYTWEGRRPEENAPPRPLDKGDADLGHADIDVNKGQHISVWIEGDGLPSARVANLHTDHEANEKSSDGQDGNTRFHHSFLVTFQRTQSDPAPVGVDDALYVRDADPIQDGAVLKPDRRFVKQWVMRNTGDTIWDDGYRLVHTANERLGAPDAVPVPVTPPGAEATIAVEFVTHASPGELRSDWRLANPAGLRFGAPVWTIVYAPSASAGDIATDYPPPAGQLIDAEAITDFTARATARFWNRYGGLIFDECASLNIDPADAVGVLVTESAGQPFGADGRMVIRFENHLFWRFWGKANPETFNQHFRFGTVESWKEHFWRPQPDGPWLSAHTGENAAEWQLFNFARRFDERAAIQSISMGAAQIMGFNYTTVGYPTPEAMFTAFEHDAGAQLRALFRFMEVNNLVAAIRARDYRRFAVVYNGPGQPDFYAGKMREYAAAFASVRPAAPLPAGVVEEMPAPAAAPQPTSPKPGVPLAEADSQLYAAWREHIAHGFRNNETMFRRVLEAFMNPYWTTVWMYRILFGVGVTAFVVAAAVALIQNNVVTTLIFGGLSVAAFLGYFISRPLQALEENLQFITWLGIIYNSYWTTLTQAQDAATYLDDVKQATDDAIARIKELMDKHTARSGARPNAKD
jgi:hypothetical protein